MKEAEHCNQKEGTVEFNIDAQGMLGGQYWSPVYTVNGSLYGETEKFFNKDKKRNDIVGAEKLQGNWWYLWRDYDGTDKSYQ